MKKPSLKNIVVKALDEQDIQGSARVTVNKISDDSYGIQITVESRYVDDVDEIAIYDYISDTEYWDSDINIDIIEKLEDSDRLEYTYSLSDNDDESDSRTKTDEDLMVEADDLHVFDPNEDQESDYSDEYGEDGDDFDESFYSIPENVADGYSVSWQDVEDFEKEFGDK